MIRADVRRDGPGEWSFRVADDQGEIVAGLGRTWAEAFQAATRELELLDDQDTARAAAVPMGLALIRGPITPGDRTVPAVDFRCNLAEDRRPAWRKWLGLP